MYRKASWALVGVVVSTVWPGVLFAQFPSELVSFEGVPSGNPADQEMFWEPEWSGSTSAFIVANSAAGVFDRNAAFRNPNVNFATQGAQALEVLWKWVDQTRSDAWVRLTTFNHAIRPNPTLDTRGKVRLKITNFGDFVGGELGLCIGVRETGKDVAQLADGGTSGPIEWVGVDPTINAILAGSNGIAETTASGDDVQEILVGSNGLIDQAVVISPGLNGVIDSTPAGDDTTRYGYFIGSNGSRVPIPAVTIPVGFFSIAVEWDLVTGDVTVDGVPTTGAIVAFTGNGVLDPPNFRGTLDHLAFTNVTTDPATNPDPGVPDAFFGIDELQFEATVADPVSPPSVVTPVFEGATTVQVQATVGATQTELFVNGGSVGTATPNGITGLSTHNFTPALVAGDVLTATQTKDAQLSDPSAPVLVFAVGVLMADSFDTYSTDADLNVFWTDSISSPSPADAQVRLQAGGAASCPNFLREDNPSSSDAARLWRSLGSVDGTDADPLWVAWNFRYTGEPNPSSGARTRFELAHFDGAPFALGARGEGTAGITIYNQVLGALYTDYNLTLRVTANTALLADLTSNGWTSAGGFARAPSGVVHGDDGWHKMQIEVRSTTINYYIDGVLVNPAAYAAGVPRPNATPYTHLIIGEGYSNNGPMMMVDNVSVTQGSGGTLHPFPDPEVVAPTVASPLFPDDSVVTITDIDTSGATTDVTVYADGVQIGNVTTTAFESPTLVVSIAPNLVNGEFITATQTIGGSASCDSIPVQVGVPAPTLDDANLVPTQVTVTLGGIVPGLTTDVSVYTNETNLIGYVTTSGFASATVSVPVSPALVEGDLITATQTIGGVEGFASAARTVAVPAPTLAPGLIIGDNVATVNDVHPLATAVTVYVDDVVVGTISTTGVTSVVVALSSNLAAGNVVEATQTIGGIEGPRSASVTITTAFCNVVFYSDMDTNGGEWAVNVTSDGFALFGFDYSTMGVPPSPHGGGSTIGLRMEANVTEGAANKVVATPIGVSMSGQYQVRFDFWINMNGPSPFGGTGSTEFCGGGIGYDGTTADINGAALLITGEAGSSRDWRMYKDTSEQFVASGQYDVDTNNGNTSVDLQAGFPGFAAPLFQQTTYPQQNDVPLRDGSGGFAWHTMVITVDSVAGRANFVVDGVSIGTVDANTGNTVATAGNVQVMYADLFSSISDNADLSFGVIDNFVVLSDLTAGVNGDWDGDLDVDLVDYDRFADCLAGPNGIPNPVVGPGCISTCRDVFDFDADGDIDLLDFAEFSRL